MVTGVGFIFCSWVLGLVLGLLFGGYVWYLVCLFVGWWLFLVFGLFVCGLVVIFGIWFVCWLVGG